MRMNSIPKVFILFINFNLSLSDRLLNIVIVSIKILCKYIYWFELYSFRKVNFFLLVSLKTKSNLIYTNMSQEHT